MESKYVNDDGTLTKAGLDYWKRLVARPWPLVKSQEHRDCHDLAVASLATILALGIDAIVGTYPPPAPKPPDADSGVTEPHRNGGSRCRKE